MSDDALRTDTDIVRWLTSQTPAQLKQLAEMCDLAARESDEVGALEIVAGTIRCMLKGEDGLTAQRRLAELVPDYYEEDVTNDR